MDSRNDSRRKLQRFLDAPPSVHTPRTQGGGPPSGTRPDQPTASTGPTTSQRVSGQRISKYRLLRPIGRGGMGSVWVAEDIELKRQIALKLLKEGPVDERSARRFQREGTIAAQFNHPNVVPVYEVGTIANPDGSYTHFIAMAYVAGNTLAEIIEEGSTPRDEVIRMIEESARAVHYCHGHGVIHRDLKPANILVDPQGRPMITDFGLAHADLFQTQLTRTQAVMGTPGYMAPEQVRGAAREIDARTDVHALGAILYEAVAGRMAFVGSTLAAIYDKILHDDPPPPSKFARDLPHELDAICLKALEKNPARRYQTAEQLADDLGKFRRGEPVQARPPTVSRRVFRALARRKSTVGIVGAVAIALLVSVAVFVPILRSSRQDARRRQSEKIEQMRSRAVDILTASLHARRAGLVSEMEAQEKRLEDVCSDILAEMPGAPDPWYLRGRMKRARMDFSRAGTDIGEALKRDPAFGPALYERLVLNSIAFRSRRQAIYQALFTQGLRDVDHTSRMPRLDELPPDPTLDRLKSQIAADAAELPKASRDAFPLTADQLTCAQALGESAAGQDDAARQRFSRLIEGRTLLEEAWEALMVQLFWREEFQPVIDLAGRAIDLDKGYAPFYQWRARALRALTTGDDGAGQSKERIERALEDLRRSEQLRPDLKSVLDIKSSLATGMAFWKLANGQDPRRDFAEAIECLREELRTDPGWGRHMMLGGALSFYGTTLSGAGDPADEVFREAIEQLDQAIKISSSHHRVWVWKGNAQIGYGAHLRKSGNELGAARLDADAIQSYTEALARKGDYSEPLRLRANMRARHARRMHEGETHRNLPGELRDFYASLRWDPRDLVNRAMEDYDKHLTVLDSADIRFRRGRALTLRAQLRPREDRASARADFVAGMGDIRTAVERSPKDLEFLGARVDEQLDFAAFLLTGEEDPAAEFERAERYAQELRVARPNFSPPLVAITRSWFGRAFWKQVRKEDASAEHRQVLKWAAETVAADPRQEANVRQMREHAQMYLERSAPREE